MIWFTGIAMHCLYFYLLISDTSSSLVIKSLGSALPVLHIPLIFLYTKELIKGCSLRTWLIGIVPFITYSVLFYLAFYNQFLVLDGFELNTSREAPFVAELISPSMIIIAIVFIWLIQTNIKEQERLLHQNFSNEKKRTLTWISYWLITLGAGAFLIIVSILLADLGLYSHLISYAITFLFIDVQLLIVGIYGLKQTPVFVNTSLILDVTESPVKKYEKSPLAEEDSAIISRLLIESMEKDRLYLNDDLSITDLASHIGYSSIQVSQTLNQKQGENFFDFVNSYRIEEVKKQLIDPENDYISILGIAMDAGFSSKSTFNKCFKKFTGTTPSVFKSNQQK